MAQPEGRLSRTIVEWLNKQPGVWARKKHQSQYGVNGDPDIYGCVNGRFFGIEIKLGKNKPTDLQNIRLKEIDAAGGITGVAWSLQEVKDLMMPYILEYISY